MKLSLFLAIDFSLGNKHFKDPYSLHYLNENIAYYESDSEEEERKQKSISKK
jgi:hypothetical protein